MRVQPELSHSYHTNSDKSVETASTAPMSADEGVTREEAMKMSSASKGQAFDFDYEDGKAPKYDELDWIPESADAKESEVTKTPKEKKKQKQKKLLRVKASDLGISDHTGIMKLKNGELPLGPDGKPIKIRRKVSGGGLNATTHSGEEVDMKAISDAVKLWRSENVPASSTKSRSRSKSRGPDTQCGSRSKSRGAEQRRRRSVSRARKVAPSEDSPKSPEQTPRSRGRSVGKKPKSHKSPEKTSPKKKVGSDPHSPSGRRGRSTTRKKIEAEATEVVPVVSDDNHTTFQLKRRSRSTKRRDSEETVEHVASPAKPCHRRLARSRSFRTARSPGIIISDDEDNDEDDNEEIPAAPRRGLSRSRSESLVRSRSKSAGRTRKMPLRRARSNDFELWASSSKLDVDLAETSASTHTSVSTHTRAFENRMNRRRSSVSSSEDLFSKN